MPPVLSCKSTSDSVSEVFQKSMNDKEIISDMFSLLLFFFFGPPRFNSTKQRKQSYSWRMNEDALKRFSVFPTLTKTEAQKHNIRPNGTMLVQFGIIAHPVISRVDKK